MAHTTNRETSDKQRLMEIEASQFIGYWAKTKGIKQADLTQHPQIDDIIILIKYRDSVFTKLNKSEQAVWGAIWGIVYNKRKPFKKKHLAKLEQIYITAMQRHLKDLVTQAEQNQLIKALRQNPNEKEDHDMTVKGSSDAYNIPWK
tara:strand:- start:615 stop:1052 length:438 start_codon:yes stop_codon:yes gene_type:complete